MALERLGVPFETHRVVEFDEFAIKSYNAVHVTDFPAIDITTINGDDLGIVDTDKYDYICFYSFPCGLPGTKIKVEDGYKDIEDVQLGENVLTHNNRYQRVTKVMRRQSPDYYKIKVMGSPELRLTGEHPLYVLRNEEIQWVKVKDLCLTDKVCFNVNTESRPTKCSNDILWMLGRYVADGHINKYSNNSVNFAVAFKKEEEFINHIPKEMEGRFKKFKKKCWDYRIADLDFQELCFECGCGSTNKRVPQWVLDLPVEQAKCFLDGYMAGDGHIRNDRGNIVAMFSTTSKELYLGLQQLIAKVYGVICSCYLRKDDRSKTFNDTYNCQFSPNNNSKVQIRIGDQIFTPIREIAYMDEETPVYNFEVENDNSYTCENIVVHNCTDISQAGRMQGFVEGSGTRSSLLWEVKRLLMETKEKPQILIMENVVAIHSQENKPHLQKWVSFLDSLGYTSYGHDLNACDYGVAQSRDRFFLVSILGDYNYKFPQPMDLRYCIEDYFQELTEEEALKYVVKSEKAMDLLVELNDKGELA